jgi:hypothetical protein
MSKGAYDFAFGPIELCAAITAAAAEHVRAVKKGAKSWPATAQPFDVPRFNVRELWTDTRIEAAVVLIAQPNAYLSVLATMGEYDRLLDILSEARRYASKRSPPTGDPVCDTALATLASFAWLRLRGIDACAAFARDGLYAQFRRFGESCAAARQSWQSFAAAMSARAEALPTLPKTPLHLWWEEVTALSKEVSLASIYGSDYGRALRHDEAHLRKQGQTLGDIEQLIDRIDTAKEPDDLLLAARGFPLRKLFLLRKLLG